MNHQKFRDKRLRTLPDTKGIYVLCDLDEVPLYIGKSADGIRTRLRRHLTSARSDLLAERRIDVWEIAYVWAYSMHDNADDADLDSLESILYQKHKSTLINGVTLPSKSKIHTPKRLSLSIMHAEEIARRKKLINRLPRQFQHTMALLDFILETYDKPYLRRSLKIHFERLARYHAEFQIGFDYEKWAK